MRKFLLSLAFFVALGASSVYADKHPSRERVIRAYDERAVYRDARGEYHWQVIEREIWVPARRVGSLLGSRVIRAHYEIRRQRVKVYHYNRYYERGNSYPKGQQKRRNDKYEKENRRNKHSNRR